MPAALRLAAGLAIAVVGCGAVAGDAGAHGGLGLSSPAAGATLGAAPTAVVLSFTERPEPSLSTIQVRDAGGASVTVGAAQPVAADPRSLEQRVRDLPEGVYTVHWRIVSAVDGHAAAGAYAFGVGVSPAAAAAALQDAPEPSTTLELIARWLLLAGLALLVGAAAAAVAGFGGRRDAQLAAAATVAAAFGVALLAEAQLRYADVAAAELLDTAVGRALVWRAVAVAVAGAAVLVSLRRFRRSALGVAGAAALAAVAVHVAAGHAAAGGWPVGASVVAQSAHFAAAGVWLGGLAALLLGVRGAPSRAKAEAVRRFSAVALVALAAVAVTGTLRAIDELSSWRELGTTGYGRAVVLKAVLVLAIAGFGLLQRSGGIPRAATDLGPLRRVAHGELVLAAVAIGVAAVLGAIPPPAAGEVAAQPGLSASGTDASGSVRVGLTAASAGPGRNSFTVTADDPRSEAPVRADAVRLRFEPLDDPGVDASSLRLAQAGPGRWEGAGDGLAFDGRWRVTVQVARGGEEVEVPLAVDVAGPAQFVSIERVPGEAPRYDVYLGGTNGLVRFSPDPERPGAATLTVTFFDVIGDERALESAVLTAAVGDGPMRRLDAGRAGSGSFAARLELAPGPVTLAALAWTADGRRLRAQVEIEVPDE